eukprot:TRINITY_DN38117_c0_g1_i1.p1 TRINITY_DN38117_c0_g1~~TRINITY_DN38117_c0_g1_i1.p1  ORF type:complete len:609 (+),score=126.68 TRINITY_DN38117_c0_g1_i1:1057-2883(+)
MPVSTLLKRPMTLPRVAMIEQIQKVFKEIDVDGDGVILRSELIQLFQQLDPCNWSVKCVDAIIEAADADKDGAVNLEEFINWVTSMEDESDEHLVSEPSFGSSPSHQKKMTTGPITLSIVRMNGQQLRSITLNRTDLVKSLHSAATESLGGQLCRLASGSTFLGNRMTLAEAGLKAGDTVTAVATSGLLEMVSTGCGGYAALKADGSVVSWGSGLAGGDASAVAHELRRDVVRLHATWSAFAALKSDRSVVTWGSAQQGGNSCSVAEHLRGGVVQVACTQDTFAALKDDGSVVVWGTHEPSIARAAQLTEGVTQIFSNKCAFVALKADGSLVTWGDPRGGGKGGELLGSGFTQVFSTNSAFTALKSDGSIVAWGDHGAGGFLGDAARRLASKKVRSVFSTSYAFAVVNTEPGDVVTWGHPDAGGKLSDEVATALGACSVQTIVATESAFAALRHDGSVVCWGWEGACAAGVAEELSRGVTSVVATSGAFAALKEGGAVVAWGNPSVGGSVDAVAERLDSGVEHIFATSTAFAALTLRGAVVAWGDPMNGGDTSSVTDQLYEGVADILVTRQAFLAVKMDNSVVAWGRGMGDSAAIAQLQPFYAPVAAG